MERVDGTQIQRRTIYKRFKFKLPFYTIEKLSIESTCSRGKGGEVIGVRKGGWKVREKPVDGNMDDVGVNLTGKKKKEASLILTGKKSDVELATKKSFERDWRNLSRLSDNISEYIVYKEQKEKGNS